MISIKGLHKFFNKGRQNEIHVINDVSLDLPESGITAIFGKSGCGKTTLLNVIGGLDTFADGTLTIESQSIKENTDVIRNKYIGYIFQNYNLNKEKNCFDNVADALRLCGMTDEDEIAVRVEASLANVGMEKYAKRTPDTLSGGQQQRIAIARAIVKNPRIILADEPTGNLDEANTVMVMDLLKAISKDHLVLLVTHEANLVDHYCDTVIELEDGKIVGKRQNSLANGFTARDKNHIYLGELSRYDITDENAHIEYYGEAPNSPIELKIINSGGRIYVQIGTEKVQVLDEFSEVKLKEGVFEEKAAENITGSGVDMSAIPPVKGTRFGKLFSFGSAVKSGYVSNFKSGKKGKKLLRTCMALFAAVIVLMTAIFGTSIGDIVEAKQSYNHNVFYVYTPSYEVSAKLNGAVGDESTGVDYVRLMWSYPENETIVRFRTGTFETFSEAIWESNFYTNAVYLDMSLATDLELVEGTRDNLSSTDILISTRVADALLEKSTLGYIKERADLIGLVSDMFIVEGRSPRIAGIVESEESAIYLTEVAMAKYVRETSSLVLDIDTGTDVTSGQAVLAIRNQRDDIEYPKVGETIKIHGRDIKVVEIKYFNSSYDSWLTANGILKDEYSFFYNLVKAENPQVIEGTDEFYDIMNKALEERWFEYYDYYCSEVEAFLNDYRLFANDDFYFWLYFEKDVEIAKYVFLPEEYYKAYVYKEMYGEYPTLKQLAEVYDSLPYSHEAIRQEVEAYEKEYYDQEGNKGYADSFYIVDEQDYIAFSKQIGESHPTVENNYYYYGKMSEDVMYDSTYPYVYNFCYTLIHSADPEKTEAWLSSELGDLQAENEYYKAIVTPDTMLEKSIGDSAEDIISGIITMVVILALMCLCMYFIMRSSLMSRIKEVGIYRAIGVSKGNLVFKFFIEAIVLTTLTVFVGYIIVSGFLCLCIEKSTLVKEVFYYPLWLAGLDLIILYAISILFGVLPVLSLIRKTPSEILAKYDI